MNPNSAPTARQSAFLFAVFALSGAAGLIYESIWSHYLKLFLGHAAYAQTLVLVIFMGGLALGAWCIARVSNRIGNLLRGFALVEGVIGLFGIAFHPMYLRGTQWLFNDVLPDMGADPLIPLVKWVFAALLVLPQSVLLGMSFPLIAGAMSRRFPHASGKSIAWLYFSNSLGASVGVLVGGFVLIAAVGLPGTVLAAGLVNIILAGVVWFAAKKDAWSLPAARAEPIVEATPMPGATTSATISLSALLWVSALTGVASFIYEIAWIRMLSMVLGATTHSFELMLSAFILGLAIGAAWIRGRIDRLSNPVRFLGYVQVAMAMMALLSLFAYSQSFLMMSFFLDLLETTDESYIWFLLASHGLALLVMLPATICAGMTLPLITVLALRVQQGARSEGAIGFVYAVNTLGAIVGVLLAVHLLMPSIGLKGLMLTGIAIDLALALALLYAVHLPGPDRLRALAAGGGVLLFVATAAGFELDPRKMSSGVYRTGAAEIDADYNVLYHQDGKTATITVLGKDEPRLVSLLTNGKPDASMNLDPESTNRFDEPTQILLGAIPLAYRPDATNAAVIGFGSGYTTDVLLASPKIQSVDSIEIEAKVIEASHWFKSQIPAAFDDPRSHIHIDDAKTYFAATRGQYDIIVSEPSNPWVSGVSSLFTEEFYTVAAHHLKEGGVFTQWIQLYEIDVHLVASIFKALDRVFSDYEVYVVGDASDLVVVASNQPRLTPRPAFLFERSRLKTLMSRAGLSAVGEFHMLRVAGRTWFSPFFESVPIPANSDFFPILDLGAPRARFLRKDAVSLTSARSFGLPVSAMLDPSRGQERYTLAGSWSQNTLLRSAQVAHASLATLTDQAWKPFLSGDAQTWARLSIINAGLRECATLRATQEWFTATLDVLGSLSVYVDDPAVQLVVDKIRSAACTQQLPAPESELLDVYLAAAVGNLHGLRDSGRRALERGPDAAAGARWGYVLAVTVAAELALNNQPAAQEIWRQHRVHLVVPKAAELSFLILQAHVESPL